MKSNYIFTVLLLVSLEACAQTEDNDQNRRPEKTVGGPCEGCEAALEFGDKPLTSIDTLPDFHDPGPKLQVGGTIYQSDGKTPANNVILYVYHTDQNGEYPKKGDETGWARQHGYIRGWIRTNEDGKYRFYTLKPGAYPGAGIHRTYIP
jgi:protocatechuate 3,4-dioxygenase, beta subunit